MVSYGKSSAENCQVSMETKDTSSESVSMETNVTIEQLYPDPLRPGLSSPLWAGDAIAYNDGVCNARGNSMNLIRTCPFGMDSLDTECGHQTLTLPRNKIPDREPDDSCARAKNGLCEDQLFFSEVAPNDVKLHHLGACLPNTE